jgi:hypothetical protein
MFMVDGGAAQYEYLKRLQVRSCSDTGRYRNNGVGGSVFRTEPNKWFFRAVFHSAWNVRKQNGIGICYEAGVIRKMCNDSCFLLVLHIE